MAELDSVLVERDGSVLTVTLNRPDVLNAISSSVIDELTMIVERQANSPDVKVLVLEGAGRSFCAGYDVTALPKATDFQHRWADASAMTRLIRSLDELVIPKVARLHGHVVGAGLILAMLCDLRYGAPDTVFLVPEMDLGMPYSYGGIPRLVRHVGPGLATDMVLNARPVTADRAAQSGLLTEVVDSNRLDKHVADRVEQLAARPAAVMVSSLLALRSAADSLVPMEASDLPRMFLAMDDAEAGAVTKAYVERFAE